MTINHSNYLMISPLLNQTNSKIQMAMTSQYLQNRLKIDQVNNQASQSRIGSKARPDMKKAKARRALWSLGSAIMIPLFLTISINLTFGSSKRYEALMGKPFWFPSLWLIHTASIACSMFMSLAAWLVWADGGFHEQTNAFPLFVLHVSLSAFWSPLVLKLDSTWLGFLACLMHFGTLFAIYRCFRRFNPFAKDLVKPCLGWVAFLTFLTYNIVTLEKKQTSDHSL